MPKFERQKTISTAVNNSYNWQSSKLLVEELKLKKMREKIFGFIIAAERSGERQS